LGFNVNQQHECDNLVVEFNGIQQFVERRQHFNVRREPKHGQLQPRKLKRVVT
jgi:hypothetical protein